MTARFSRILSCMALVVAALACPEPAACALDDARTLRRQVSAWYDAGRYLRVLDCLERVTTAPNPIEANLDAQARDELRYFIANTISDSIFRSNDQRLEIAAAAWERYLKSVSAPYDANRVNHAIVKLNSYARETRYRRHWPSLVIGIEKIGAAIEGAAGIAVLSTLYRCDRWSSPASVSNDVPCREPCRGMFTDFVRVAKPAFQQQGQFTESQRLYGASIRSAERRLQCDTP